MIKYILSTFNSFPTSLTSSATTHHKRSTMDQHSQSSSSAWKGFQGYLFGEREKSPEDDTPAGMKALSRPTSPSNSGAAGKFFHTLAQNSPFRSASVALPRLEKGAIQHEMIVAYLYQQQCRRFWISENQTVDEGAFMRETWDEFITAPQSLSQSDLAEALIDLNAEVCSLPAQLPRNESGSQTIETMLIVNRL